MIVLYIFAGLLLFLLLLTLIPLRMSLSFQETFSLELRYLFWRYQVLPGEEEPEEEKAPPQPEDKLKKERPQDRVKTALRREGLSGFLQGLGELLGLLGQTSKRILRRVKLKEFDLYLCLAGEDDPAAAAVRYGQVAGGVYSACGGLFALTPCKQKGVTVDLDYSGAENIINFTAKLSILPFFLIKEGLKLFFKGMGILKKVM